MNNIKNINKNKYYIKDNTDFFDEAYIEIICSKLAKLVDLNCPEYSILKENGTTYSASLDLNKQGKFYLAKEYVSFDNDLIVYLFKTMSKLNSVFLNKDISQDFIKTYAFDIILANPDRNTHNFGFIEKNNNFSFVILDNALSFSYSNFPTILGKHLDEDAILYDKNLDLHKRNVRLNYYYNAILQDLNYVLENGSSDIRNIILSTFSILTPEVIQKTILDVFTEYKVNPRQITDYQNHAYVYKRLHKKILK